MRRLDSLWIEWAFALAIVAGSAYSLGYLWFHGFLPQPFFIDPFDTFMDWFNTSYWARDPGTYDVWRSVYPPLSFVFLRIFGWDLCYDQVESSDARGCDTLGMAAIAGFYVLDIVLIAWSYYRIDRRTALPRALAVTAGFPMLFGLDRGNLVIPCLAAFVLGYGPLTRSTKLRWLGVALAVNFKPYLVASIFPQLLRRRWRWFEGAALAIAIVYIVTWGIFGQGSVPVILENTRYFAEVTSAQNWSDTYAAASFAPLLAFMNSNYPMIAIVGSYRVEFWENAIAVVIHAAQLVVMLACFAAWLKPRAVPMYRLTNLAVLFATITFEAGAYSMVFFLFLLFLEPWKSPSQVAALIAGYVMCIPADYRLANLNPPAKESFLAGRPVFVDYGITVAPFVRPAFPLIIAFVLAIGTIVAAIRMHRREARVTLDPLRAAAPA